MQHAQQANARPRTRSRHRGQNKVAASDELVVYDDENAALDPQKQKGQSSHGAKRRAATPSSNPGPNIREGDVRKAYKVLPIVIGTGSFGTVRSCIHRDSRTKLAIKSIAKKGHASNAHLLLNEITIHQRLKHKNVVKVVDVIQDREYIHIIMEQCKGGDLFDMTVDDKTKLGESKARRIVASLLDAVAYLHDRNIVHRDLKAEHLMFASSDTNSPIKIIDFGVATTHKPGDAPMTAFAGSLRSVAPEVVKRSYGKECDMWSVGIITYFLLTQMMPFNGENNQEIFAKITAGRFFFPQWAETGLSEEAKDFIDRLLVVDPNQRLTAKQAMSHLWIKGKRMKRPAGESQASPATSKGGSQHRGRNPATSKGRSQHRGRNPATSKGRSTHGRSQSRGKRRSMSRSRHGR